MIFARFIPPREIGDAVGTWIKYYVNCPQRLRSQLAPDQLLLRTTLRDLLPPPQLFDRQIYSPWTDGCLHRRMQQKGIMDDDHYGERN